jgi:hypothetical protein
LAAEGGANEQELKAALGMIRERFEVAAFGIASYDPTSTPTEGSCAWPILAAVYFGAVVLL